jgi:TFIIF-interacting CTD phosphatase-like protein
MSKWEYMCLEWYSSKQMNTNMLNALGGDGWELIQIANGEAVLKRKLKEEKKSEKEEVVDNSNFEECWKLYRRKGSKKKSLEQWLKLTPEEQEQVLNHIPAYVESVSDVKYQKDFCRYLRDKCFLNVVYKGGKTIFDAETPNEPQKEDKLIVNGVIYR